MVESVAYLKKCLKAGFDAQHKHPNHIMMVTYENLIARPETVTRQMCAFLGIKWSEQMLIPGDFYHMGSKTIVNNVWYTESMYNRNPDPGEIEKWRSNLSPGQVNYIYKQLLEDENLKLAYPDELKDMKLHGAVISGSLGSMRYRLRHWLKNNFIPMARQKIKSLMEIIRNRQSLLDGLKKKLNTQ